MVSTTIYNNAHLSNLRNTMDLVIDDIAYTQFTRLQIPCGYTGDTFLKSFDDIFNEGDAKYLQEMYAEHHELYKYETEMIEKLTEMRTMYEDIESALFTEEAVADAKARGIIPKEDKSALNIAGIGMSYDEDEAFGETYDFA
jgi:hypothetical protein